MGFAYGQKGTGHLRLFLLFSKGTYFLLIGVYSLNLKSFSKKNIPLRLAVVWVQGHLLESTLISICNAILPAVGSIPAKCNLTVLPAVSLQNQSDWLDGQNLTVLPAVSLQNQSDWLDGQKRALTPHDGSVDKWTSFQAIHLAMSWIGSCHVSTSASEAARHHK